MKPICVLLAFASTFSCFHAEAVDDRLQNDCYSYDCDYRRNTWLYRNNTYVNEDKACIQRVTADGTIEFGPDAGPLEENCSVFKWHVTVDGYDVNVTINYLELNENAGNYLIISPGPSLVQDEASVVITGKIQTTKMFRVTGHSEMTILLVIQDGMTNETWKDNSFKLSYQANGPVTEKPTTTTPEPTFNTPEPGVDYDVTVYVDVVTAMFNSTTRAFKTAVASMSNKYCNRYNIELLSETQSDNVQLTLITECPITWPNRIKCTEVNMVVAVNVPPGKNYELTRSSLEKMWQEYAKDELSNINLQIYEVPDDDETFSYWLYVSLGVAAIFTLIMTTLWYFNFFNKKVVPTPHDSKVISTTKDSWISNPYQEVPPNFELPYEDTDNQPTADHEITTSPDSLSVPHDRPTSADQYNAAFFFGNRVSNTGYDNPSFDVSSEQHHTRNTNYTDDFSSDDESRANTSAERKSYRDHLHTAPRQVTYNNDKQESAF